MPRRLVVGATCVSLGISSGLECLLMLSPSLTSRAMRLSCSTPCGVFISFCNKLARMPNPQCTSLTWLQRDVLSLAAERYVHGFRRRG